MANSRQTNDSADSWQHGGSTDALASPFPCSVVLVGLMGAGKTAVGRLLAERLSLPFVDADTEIETAAGESIEEIFQRHGEGAFRDGERRVMVLIEILSKPVAVRVPLASLRKAS